MQKKFWLIQTAKWNNFVTKELSTTTSFTDGLLDLNYMGSAEFEFGAIPKAYRRIMGDFDRYMLFETPIKNRNGVPLQLYCKISRMVPTLKALNEYLKEGYPLKDYCGLNEHIKPTDTTGRYINCNVWWNIQNSWKDEIRYDEESVYDWIAFFGTKDRREIFLNVINNDYNNWWMQKSEEDRKFDLDKSINSNW